MSELFRPSTIIPKGYTLAITTWENDADHYDTLFVKGLPTKEITNQVLRVVRWFSRARDDMGNDTIKHEEILSRLYDCYHDGIISTEFFDRFLPDVSYPPAVNSDENHDDWLDTVVSQGGYDEVEEMVRDFLGCAVEYDYDHARVVDSVEIYFFEEDYKVPDAAKSYIKFDGSYQNRQDQSEWSL